MAELIINEFILAAKSRSVTTNVNKLIMYSVATKVIKLMNA